jgi:spermidine synthase
MILKQLNECNIILHHRTDYQDILITEVDGLRSLYLDGDLQFDNNNESYYHEQLVGNLNEYTGGIKDFRVCIVGGGDGGCARDLLQYKPKHVTLVEIDSQIIDISIKYFPALNKSGKVFEQINVCHMDATEYLRGDIKLDAIILDVTIPNESSLSESLFSKSFIDTLARKVDFLSFFISYKAVHNLDFNIFKSFTHYNAYKMYVPRYEHNGMVNIVAEF